MSEEQQKQMSPTQLAVQDARRQLNAMEAQFVRALPAHIPAERFGRVVMTAIQNNPDLVTQCTRQSLWNAAMRAAQDGLLPDGREGAIVKYGNEAQWMPMIAGIRKKARNSGVLRDWYVEVFYQGEVDTGKFVYEKGDSPFVKHQPLPPSQRGAIAGAYSIAVFMDGTRSAPEVMWTDEIEAVRKMSKAPNSPAWKGEATKTEMYKKVVARRHSKSLPSSSDLDDLIRRDDHLYEVEKGDHAGKVNNLTSRLDQLAGPKNGAEPVDDLPPNAPSMDGEIIDAEAVDRTEQAPVNATVPSPADEPEEFLKWLDEVLPRVKSQEEVDEIWSKHIASSPKKPFPSDLDLYAERFQQRKVELKTSQ